MTTDAKKPGAAKTARAKITEKLVKERIKGIIEIYARYNCLYTLCPMTMGYGESGHPDCLLKLKGRHVGIEAKKDRNNHHTRPELAAKPNEVHQARQALRIRAAGGEWVCIHYGNLPELRTLLDKVAQIKSHQFPVYDVAALERLLGE